MLGQFRIMMDTQKIDPVNLDINETVVRYVSIGSTDHRMNFILVPSIAKWSNCLMQTFNLHANMHLEAANINVKQT